MNVRPLATIRRRASGVGTLVLIVASIGLASRTTARAQSGRAAGQHPAQGLGTSKNLIPNGMPRAGYPPYPVRDPTADERAAVAGRVYRAVLDEWTQRAMAMHRPDRAEPDAEARSDLEVASRLGPWSLRWQDAQDNAARSRGARYQAMSDHLGRMSALEDGRILRATGQANEVLVGPKPHRGSAEVARFFRPIDELDIDRIIPTLLVSERPLNPQGVAVTPAEQAEIADRVYHMILDEAVNRFKETPRGETRPDEAAIFDAPLAERLGFWSELWRQAQDVAAGDPTWRSQAVRDRSARVPSAGANTAGLDGRTAAMRSHIERMSALETGRFIDHARERAGRSAAQPVDMTRLREFAEVARFLRIESESQPQGATRSKGTDVTDSGQAATAGRIYSAILNEAAHRYREAPRAGEAIADFRPVFDSLLSERLAAWSIRWARAQIRTDLSRVSQFNAVRSHVERMASLEDGRSFHDAVERAGRRVVGVGAPPLPHEFADVARFFRLEALWELEQFKSR